MESRKLPPKSTVPAEPKPGRVRHDKSGRAVWEWAVETGRHALDSTSRLLKKLEAPGLSLEETQRVAKMKPASPVGNPAPRAPKAPEQPRAKEALSLSGSSGFNPYNSRGAAPRRASPSAHPAAARPAARPATPQPAPSPGMFSRLFGGKK